MPGMSIGGGRPISLYSRGTVDRNRPGSMADRGNGLSDAGSIALEEIDVKN